MTQRAREEGSSLTDPRGQAVREVHRRRVALYMSLDAPCEEKLAGVVRDYNTLADDWIELRSLITERDERIGELERTLRAADIAIEHASRSEHSFRGTVGEAKLIAYRKRIAAPASPKKEGMDE